MAIVRLEIDIDPQGNPIVTPNPVVVAEGDIMEFHVNSNHHGAKDGHVIIEFPPNKNSPFGYERQSTQIRLFAVFCQSGESPNPARWPPNVEEYVMSVSYRFNPSIETKLVVRKAKTATLA